MPSKGLLLRLFNGTKKKEAPPTTPTQTTPVADLAGSEDDTKPYGLKILVEGNDPVIDIVAVHGLNGHRQKTWTVNDKNWLQDFLPNDIPQAQILSWGFDANTYSRSPISSQHLYDHARTLVSDLCLMRKLTKTRERPIIFVAHSLGGIVVKSALIHSDTARRGALEEQHSIKISTYGILFMGTPHQGGNGVRLGAIMVNVASIFVETNEEILKHLTQDSEWLQQQLGQYASISNDFVTKFAYEIYPTPIAMGRSIMIVPKASAVVHGAADAEPIAIPADHRNMVKFASRSDPGYNTVSGHLQLMVQEAPKAVQKQWEKHAQSNTESHFSLPFSLAGVPMAEHFIGRRKELEEMKKALRGDGTQRQTVVLHGLGGIGKTQLAVQFLKETREKYAAALWLNGKSEVTLKQSLISAAKRVYNEHSSSLLRPIVESKDEQEIIQCLKRWLSIKANTRWLLVFDNIDNPKLSGNTDAQAYDIRLFFPEHDAGSILVTTRSSGLRLGNMIHVKKLSDANESISILASMSGRSILPGDLHALTLANKLDGLPLALATAGAYLNQLAISLKDYLRHYDESWSLLQQESPELLSYESRTMYTTWKLSYDRVQSMDGAAAELFKLWAYFDNQDLWYELLAAGIQNGPQWFREIVSDEIRFNKTVRILCDHALVEPFESSNGYDMHSCVYSWAKYVLNSEFNLSFGKLALACVGFSVPDNTVPQYWEIEKRLLPHADQIDRNLPNYMQLQKFGSEEESIAFHGLGNLYSDQGKMEKAEAMYLRALEGKEKPWGAEHTSTLNTINNLGILYSYQGKMEKAEAMYLQALEGFEKAWGTEHTSTLDTVNNLGNLYSDQGKMKKAEAMYLRALEGYRNSRGDAHPTTQIILRNLNILRKL